MARSIADTPAAQAYERQGLLNLQHAIGQTIIIHAAELREMPPHQELKAILRCNLGDFVSAQAGVKKQAQALIDELASNPEPIEAFVQPVESDRAHGNTLCRLVAVPAWDKETVATLARLLGVPLERRKGLFDEAGGRLYAIAEQMQRDAWAATLVRVNEGK